MTETQEQIFRLCLDVADAVDPGRPEYNVSVAELLAMIRDHESVAGEYVRQGGFSWASESGAWGEWQMERAAAERVRRLLLRRPELAQRVNAFLRSRGDSIFHAIDWGEGLDQPVERCPVDLLLRLIAIHDPLACVWARLYLLFDPQMVPENPTAMADMAKRFWNTYQGKATPEKYLNAYRRHTEPIVGKVLQERRESATDAA